MSLETLQLVLLTHAAATWFMVGLIWFVQIVHYPLMARVPAEAGPEYARAHQNRTGWVVIPAMLTELACASVLAVVLPGLLTWMGLGLLLGVWISTFAVQVPLHRKLARCSDQRVCGSLVVTNWVRTLLWTARGIIALLLLGWP